MKCLLYDLSTFRVLAFFFCQELLINCIEIFTFFCFVCFVCKKIFLNRGRGFMFSSCQPELSMFRPLGPDHGIFRLYGTKVFFFMLCGLKESGFRPCESSHFRFKPCEPKKNDSDSVNRRNLVFEYLN